MFQLDYKEGVKRQLFSYMITAILDTEECYYEFSNKFSTLKEAEEFILGQGTKYKYTVEMINPTDPTISAAMKMVKAIKEKNKDIVMILNLEKEMFSLSPLELLFYQEPNEG